MYCRVLCRRFKQDSSTVDHINPNAVSIDCLNGPLVVTELPVQVRPDLRN